MALAGLFTVLMIIPAWACYTFIEKPGRTYFQMFISKSIKKRESKAGLL